jgi:spermidine synthase
MKTKPTPYWKKLWSYITPVLLETTSSEHNEHLEVLMIEGRHQLNTEDAIYSFDDKYENFNYTFGLIDWDKLRGQNVLCLGLGLGSVIYMLEKKWGQKLDYTAVEIDPEICRMAHHYTTNHLSSYVEVINTDAEIFLEVNQEKYDMIIMDIFQSASIPYKFQSKEYIQTLKEKLQPNGLLMYNRMNVSSIDQNDYIIFEKEFAEVFPDCIAIPVSKNIVIINDKTYLK